MKILLLLCLWCVLVCTNAFTRGDLEKYGPFQIALKSGMIKCDHDRTLNLDVSNIDVYLYDYPNKYVTSYAINDAAQGILSYKNLDKSKKFFIFVGGFKSHIMKQVPEQFRQTFSDFPNSYVIIIDHNPYTHDADGAVKGYTRAVRYVHYIGKAVGDMLTGLEKGGISRKNMHAVGHSLGAQILAHAGETFLNNTGEKIARITGLDPAGPCFSNSLIQEQLRSGVAEYVEVYHCNAGGLGTSSVLADIDVFLNKKGQFQPSCKVPLIPGFFDSSKAARCSHRACVDYWLASVKNPTWYQAWKCNSYKEYKTGSCTRNEVTTAGFWSPGNATGTFYFSTAGYKI